MAMSTLVDATWLTAIGDVTTQAAQLAENLKQLLIASSDWFAQEVMKGVQKSPYDYLSPAQSRLLANMGGKPMSMAELARRLAISRQAVHKMVMELSRRGILALQEDPGRRHGKLVVYTEKGRQLNRTGAQLIDRIELSLAQKLGAEQLANLKRLLEQIR